MFFLLKKLRKISRWKLSMNSVICCNILYKRLSLDNNIRKITTAPLITLSNGQKCPQLGLATWLSRPNRVEEAVKHAIKVGYRHIDCAMIYGNEREVGNAVRARIADHTVKREDLFIVSKLWNTDHEKDKVIPACKQSLKNFGLEYIDLFLIHWPIAQQVVGKFDPREPFKNVQFTDYDYINTWLGMEDCVKSGLTKSIGLSNFNSKQIQRIMDMASINPVMNQIEVHPNFNQKILTKFCKDRKIEVTGYAPFGSRRRLWGKPGHIFVCLENPKLIKIGKKYSKMASQVILRYLIHIGVIPIPKSITKSKIDRYINIFDFHLSPEEVAFLDSLDCNGRAIMINGFKASKHYPFTFIE